jgi:hypothetical protein
MTLATHWYDQKAGKARSYEAHFKVARYGNITTVRRRLAQRGVPFFQRAILQQYGVRIPKGKIRVSFEREEPTRKIESKMEIKFRRMEYRAKQREAIPMPSKVFSYVKRHRRRRHR